jgi:hypothetical protein
LVGKGVQLLLRSGVVLVIRIDRRLKRSGVGKDGAGHVADEERYWSCETLTSSWPLPRLAGRMRSFAVLGR